MILCSNFPTTEKNPIEATLKQAIQNYNSGKRIFLFYIFFFVFFCSRFLPLSNSVMLKVKYFLLINSIFYTQLYNGCDTLDSSRHFRLNSIVIKGDKDASGSKRQTNGKTEKEIKHLLCPISDKVLTMKRLNNQPRKRLGFKTHNQVFLGDKLNFARTT